MSHDHGISDPANLTTPIPTDHPMWVVMLARIDAADEKTHRRIDAVEIIQRDLDLRLAQASTTVREVLAKIVELEAHSREQLSAQTVELKADLKESMSTLSAQVKAVAADLEKREILRAFGAKMLGVIGILGAGVLAFLQIISIIRSWNPPTPPHP